MRRAYAVRELVTVAPPATRVDANPFALGLR